MPNQPPESLVIGCNNQIDVGVLSDWIEEQYGSPLDLDRSGWSDGFDYGFGCGQNGYGYGNGYGYHRNLIIGDGHGDGDGYGNKNGNGYGISKINFQYNMRHLDFSNFSNYGDGSGDGYYYSGGNGGGIGSGESGGYGNAYLKKKGKS